MKTSTTRRRLEALLVPALRAVSTASGIFCLLMAAALVTLSASLQASDPLSSPALAELKAQPGAASDPALSGRIRALDLELRTRYFTRRGLIDTGAIILAVGFVVFAASLRAGAYLTRRIPDPGTAPRPSFAAISAGARRAILVMGVTAAAGILVSGVLVRRDLRVDARAVRNFLGLGGFPARAEVLGSWGGFRGPAAGRTAGPAAAEGALGSAAPLTVLWRTPLPLPGRGSVAAWGGRLYVTGGTAEEQDITALEAQSGRILWRRTVKELLGRSAPMPEVSADTGWAAPTPAADGKRVLALFAGGLLFCLDADGKLLWHRDFGTPDNPYGIASSPILYKDMAIVQWDQSNKSLVAALSASDGRILWLRTRMSGASWTTPIVAMDGGRSALIVVGNPSVEALDPDTGKLLWEQQCMMGDAAPSPAYSGRTVFTASNLAPASAIEVWPGAGTHQGASQPSAGPKPGDVLWSFEDDLPDTPSLLASDTLLYLVSGSGTVSAVDITRGSLAWKERLGVPVSSSPILAGDTVLLCDRQGTLHRFKDAGAYAPLPDTPLGSPLWATPAVLDGRLYMRTDAEILCLGGEQ